jgi:hypothetical protein
VWVNDTRYGSPIEIILESVTFCYIVPGGRAETKSWMMISDKQKFLETSYLYNKSTHDALQRKQFFVNTCTKLFYSCSYVLYTEMRLFSSDETHRLTSLLCGHLCLQGPLTPTFVEYYPVIMERSSFSSCKYTYTPCSKFCTRARIYYLSVSVSANAFAELTIIGLRVKSSNPLAKSSTLSSSKGFPVSRLTT